MGVLRPVEGQDQEEIEGWYNGEKALEEKVKAIGIKTGKITLLRYTIQQDLSITQSTWLIIKFKISRHLPFPTIPRFCLCLVLSVLSHPEGTHSRTHLHNPAKTLPRHLRLLCRQS